MLTFSFILILATSGNLAKVVPAKEPLHPIILVPGDGGSQIEARLNKTKTVSYWCHKVNDWFTLWLDAEQLISWASACWIDNIRLIYNQTDHTTRNNDGVETRIPGFGNSSSVEYINPYKSSYADYFSKIAEGLISLGYERGVNLHGAPYDFRKAANEHGSYFDNVTKLIEDTYEKNGKQKVILMCHSMGSPMMLYLLNQKTDAWKDKYIRAFITLAGVWGGTVRALKVYLLGDNLGSRIVDGTSIGDQERTNPSLAWLMPKDMMWGPDEVFLQSDNLNVTTKNFEQVYETLNHTDGRMMWEDTKDLLKDLKPPNVETFCLHGDSVPSLEKIVYKTTFPSSSPTLMTGDGDGTVNIRSLLGCLLWRNQQKPEVHHHVFKGVDHGEILRNPESAEYVKRLVLNITRDIRPDSVDVEVKLKPRLFDSENREPEDNYPSPLNVENFEDEIEKKFEEIFEEKFEDSFEFDPIIEVVP